MNPSPAPQVRKPGDPDPPSPPQAQPPSLLAGLSWRWTCLDSLLSAASFAIAYLLRFDGRIPTSYSRQMLAWIPAVVLVRVGILLLRGDLRISARNVGQGDLVSLVVASSLSSLAFLLASVLLIPGNRIPFGVLAIDLLAASFLLVGARVAARWILRSRDRAAGHSSPGESVLLAGPLDPCANLAEWMLGHADARLTPVGLAVDNPALDGRRVHGIRVWGQSLPSPNTPELNPLSRILLLPPLPAPDRLDALVQLGRATGARLEIAASPTGPATPLATHIPSRPLSILDLFGRGEVPLPNDHVRSFIQGRRILVTGAGGSIGSELCRQILALNPALLVLADRAEPRLFEISHELLRSPSSTRIVSSVVDVSLHAAVDRLLADTQPEILFHAAAHKHVPLMEDQPAEAIRNNTLGTATLARLALQHHVRHFVLISTDKAINPTNVMGASKRLAELHLQALQATHPDSTRFAAVRFGNVLGSSGSVVPIFQRQIADGGPLTVTHPEVTRYFMSITEAVGLVLQAGSQGRGGEIFVLDMGKPVRILQLARQMIELSGLRPDIDIQIRFTGLRPGEKLFEELSHHLEQLTPTSHPRIFRFVSPPPDLHQLDQAFTHLQSLLPSANPATLKHALHALVPEYRPHLP